LLELFRQGGFPAAHWAEQVEDLFLLLKALRGMSKEGNDLVDALFHAVEVGEGRITANHLVGKDPRESRVLGGFHQLRFADRQQHALGRTGIGAGVLAAQFQVLLQGVLLLTRGFEALLEVAEDVHGGTSLATGAQGSGRRRPRLGVAGASPPVGSRGDG